MLYIMILVIRTLAIRTLILVSIFCSSSLFALETESFQDLYNELKPKIVQIKILHRATKEKSSIGSGFVIHQPNLIATNYHVISQIATQPSDYYGEYKTTKNTSGNFKLIAFDIINDLAILKTEKPVAKPLSTTVESSKGDSIYSLGNPHDLGFVIVNGIHNGIIPNKNPPRIFYSASINSGMSGGPAVNYAGQVTAINVAVRRGSGDISFLIPVKYLRDLLQKAKSNNFSIPEQPEETWQKSISQQLLDESSAYFNVLNTAQRDYINLGQLRIPSKIGTSFKCWNLNDDKKQQEKSLVDYSGVSCRESRQHYISRDERQGKISLLFKYFHASKPLQRRRFYRHVESKSGALGTQYFGREEDNKNPAHCTSDFVYIAGHEFKIHVCTQADAKRQNLAKTKVLATSVDQKNKAWVFNLSFQGATLKQALELTQSLFDDIQRVDN